MGQCNMRKKTMDDEPQPAPAPLSAIVLSPEHLPIVAPADHVLGFLRAERARLEGELRYVTLSAARAEAELAAFLARGYDVDLVHDSWQLDAVAGVLRRTGV